MYDSREDTLKHISTVKKMIDIVIKELENRAVNHDKSKLESPEKEIFDKYTPKLKTSTYGSKEYKQFLIEMEPALTHHYANNRHHPEHFFYNECNGCFKRFYTEFTVCDICGYSQFTVRIDISQMNLIDIMEMFCDWKSATLRHDDGDLNKSIEINKKRFEISDQLISIFKNSVKLFE